MCKCLLILFVVYLPNSLRYTNCCLRVSDYVIYSQNKKRFNQTILLEAVSMVGFFLWFSLKLIYYWGENIYLKIKPPSPVSVKGEIVLVSIFEAV